MLLDAFIAFILILFPKGIGHEKISVQTGYEARSKEDKWLFILCVVFA